MSEQARWQQIDQRQRGWTDGGRRRAGRGGSRKPGVYIDVVEKLCCDVITHTRRELGFLVTE